MKEITTSKQSAAFYYHPDGYETKRGQLMGRHAAGEAFLHAYVKYAEQQRIHCYAETRKQYEHFIDKVKEKAGKPTVCSWIPWGQWTRLAEPGCIFMPGPVLKDLAWQRRHIDTRAYSICGITHTTATKVVMDAFGDLMTTPVQPWDAIICTSNSVKSMVVQTIANYSEFLEQHFALSKPPACKIQLPVIPLGVNCAEYAKTPDDRIRLRQHWRTKLNVGEDDVCFLFVGRLSAHGKAHPVPMFIALERAAKLTNQKLHLVLSGWFATKGNAQEFLAAIRELCPSVTVHIVDGRSPEVRDGIWYGADVFTSLSDNIQETFGLTPIEAMAAGLPSVVSDWDGYKETVRHGIDGLRVPTWMAPPGFGEKLAFGHAHGMISYDQYIGSQSQLTVVDVDATAAAYAALANNKQIRLQMGANAQQRARLVFDWKVIIPAYQQLWQGLAEIRSREPETTPRKANAPANPLRDDPTGLFFSYPTAHLSLDVNVKRTEKCSMERLRILKKFSMNRIADELAGNHKDIEELVSKFTNDQQIKTVSELLKETVPEKRRRLFLSILWASKMGLFKLTKPLPEPSTRRDDAASLSIIAAAHPVLTQPPA